MKTVRGGWAVAAVLLLAATVYEVAAHQGHALWTFPLGLILPDLSFLVGIGRPHEPGLLPRAAVPAYNLVHRVWLPFLLLFAVAVDSQTNDQAAPYFVLALAWLVHITADRAFGYGLRARDGSIRRRPARP